MNYALNRRTFLQSSIAGIGTCVVAGGCGGASGNTSPAVMPAPQPIAVPPWAASGSGMTKTVATSNSFLSQNGNLPGWEQAFGKIVDDYSGGVFNPYWGPLGAVVFHGGGHSATFDNSVVILDLNDLTFKRLSNPTPSNEGRNWSSVTPPQIADPAFDAAHCEYGDRQPGAAHTYDTLAVLPPADGGAACGSLIRVASFAVHVNVSANTGWAHRFDFESTTMRDGRWSRWSINGPSSYLFPGACSAYDEKRKRFWWISGLSSVPPFIRYLDAATRQQVEIAFASAISAAPAADPDSATMRYEPRRDILVLTCTINQRMVLAFLRCSQPGAGWTTPALSSPVPALSGAAHGFDFVPEEDKFVLITGADTSALYDVAPPTALNTSWSVVRRPLTSGPIPTSYVVGKRWNYVPALQSFIWIASSTSPVIVYRPT
jgi:hypothetical protein